MAKEAWPAVLLATARRGVEGAGGEEGREGG